MAPNTRQSMSGLHSHVAKQNQMAEVDIGQLSKEEQKKLFKLKTPKQGKQGAANGQAASRYGNDQQLARSQSADFSKSRSLIFATGASIDDDDDYTTTGRIAQPGTKGAEGPRQRDQDVQGDYDNNTGSSSEAGVNEDHGEEILGEDQANGQAHLAHRGRTSHGQGRFPPMAGDSYPDTTSGQLSNTGDVENQQPSETAQPTYPTQLPKRGGGTRLGIPQGKQLRVTNQQHPDQTAREHQPFSTNIETDSRDLMDDITNGFGFANPNTQQNAAKPTVHSTQPPQGLAPMKNRISSNTAQRGSPGPVNLPAFAKSQQQTEMDDSRPRSRAGNHQKPEIDNMRPPTRNGQGQQQFAPTKARRWSTQSQTLRELEDQQQRIDDNHTRDRFQQQQPIDNSRVSDHIESEHTQSDEPSMESELDYALPDLYEKSFEELKQQSLDIDPNCSEFELPDNEMADTLQQKLVAIAHLAPEMKAKFLASLDIDSWEEAGDWFIQQFGDLMKKIKETRRGKRKAVQTLEEEIAERHNAVFKKQRLTLDALGEMKESGGKVLQGTPKMTRKSK